MEITQLYEILRSIHGPCGKWWPGSAEEVLISAVLTQNTSWANVEKALDKIRIKFLGDSDGFNGNSLKTLSVLSDDELRELIKPAGFFNVKTKRVRNLLNWISKYNFDMDAVRKKAQDEVGLKELRNELLSVNGIGKETADSILCYGLDLPVFVVDAYTKRLINRIFAIESSEIADYDSVQQMFESSYPRDVEIYQELHGLIVEHSKVYCRSKPKCDECPLKDCRYKNTTFVEQKNA
ncbi:MAG TPA: endonuclease [Fervidobacterium sp.]|nr:endonuclease [Fervidobacterium sp.]HOM73906.1 endonuclease [Fervidobacterium sp.]HPP17637.1 endonuclease [Fervidobacterium sp.]